VVTKVLIERQVLPGNESVVTSLLADLRAEALRSHGYIYGETWRDADTPSIIAVLSVWASRAHWERFCNRHLPPHHGRTDKSLVGASQHRAYL
jgi:heme-degrading monooxygenase HmoA